MDCNLNDITGEIVDSCLKIHKKLGPGLLERVYQDCLFYELQKRGIAVQSEVVVPVKYEDLIIPGAFKIDLLVENAVVIELKSINAIMPIHQAQILTYMKLSDMQIGLLINFNVPLIKDGIHRFRL